MREIQAFRYFWPTCHAYAPPPPAPKITRSFFLATLMPSASKSCCIGRCCLGAAVPKPDEPVLPFAMLSGFGRGRVCRPGDLLKLLRYLIVESFVVVLHERMRRVVCLGVENDGYGSVSGGGVHGLPDI